MALLQKIKIRPAGSAGAFAAVWRISGNLAGFYDLDQSRPKM
jgi:hypothetical protein